MTNALAQTHSNTVKRAATQDSTSTGTQARYNSLPYKVTAIK